MLARSVPLPPENQVQLRSAPLRPAADSAPGWQQMENRGLCAVRM